MENIEKFLEKLYSHPYFAPVLYAVIAILAVAFIIVLIMAVKDAKKNKINNNNENSNNNSQNAFQPVQTPPVDVSVQPNLASPIIENNQPVVTTISQNEASLNSNNSFDITIDNPVEEKSNGEIVINSTPGTSNTDAPIEIEPNIQQYTNIFPQVSDNIEIEVPAKSEVASTPNFSVDNSGEPARIGIDNFSIGNSVTTQEDVDKAESDLDEIAATLLAEYKKETLPAANNVEVNDSEKNKDIDPFSSIYVTPEVNHSAPTIDNVPSFADIPTPQPVRVVNSSTVIDSSKQNNGFDFNSIATEEYNLKK